MIGSILLALVCAYLVALAIAGPSLAAALIFSAVVIALVSVHHFQARHDT